jgi:hypothetical protein
MEAPKVPQPNNDGGILESMSNAVNKATDIPDTATVPSGAAGAAAGATGTAGTGATGTAASAATGTAANAANASTGSITNIVPVNTEESINNVKEAFSSMVSTNENIFYLIVALFVFALIIAYFLYYVITDNILYQQKIDVPGTEVPIICNELSEFKMTNTMANSNGIKRTYGFWIYINDINKYAGKFRHIAHIGESAAKIVDACPYIFLDDKMNSIHVRFAPKKEPASMTDTDTLNEMGSVDSLLNYDGNRCGITIKYVPTQRWVHIVIVVSDVNGGIVYTYIDGELADQENAKERKLTLHELNFETKHSTLFVGGSVSNSTVNATGFSGLLSKFSIYNYDLNKNDIYKEYNRGPLNGLLTSMGIVGYGIRNPVYKLNSVY